MARDVNALINKCENAITQEEKTISDAKEKIRKLRKEIKKLKAEKDNQFANDLLAAIMTAKYPMKNEKKFLQC